MDPLFRYVKDQRQKGYSQDQIREQLISQGYSPTIVEGVIESVYANSPSPSQLPATRPFIAIGIFIAVAAIGLLVYFLAFSSKEALLDVKLNPDRIAAAPGDELGFDLEITNMGSKDRFDVTLNYRVFDSSENLVLRKEETIAVSTSTNLHRGIELPSTIQPGDYLLTAFANYEGKVATASFSFSIDPAIRPTEPTCADKVRNQNEIGVDCGGRCGGYWYDSKCNAEPPRAQPSASCSDGIRNQDETAVDCGGRCGGYWYDASCHSSPQNVPEVPEEESVASRMLRARLGASTDLEASKAICMTLDEEQDACLRSVAQASMEQQTCEIISQDEERDLCYYPFFMNGDFSVCEKLVLKESLQACAQLRELSRINPN